MSTKVRIPRRSASKAGKDGYRHKSSCRFSGLTLAEVSLNHDHCICDPHGTKHRALDLALEKDARRRVLSQDELWYPKEGGQVRLDEMSLRWKTNLLRFLERRAGALQDSAIQRLLSGPQPGGDMASDAFDSMVDAEIDAKPTTWLYRQPLVLKLEQLIREGHDGPVDRFDATKVVTV